ncbi:MAG TPA: glycosyltransferase family 2 protein [Opitutaceae bacterium]
MSTPAKPRSTLFISALLLGVLIAIFGYLIGRTWLFAIGEGPWYERLQALILLLAEIFILIHGVGYFRNVYRVIVKDEPARAAAKAARPPLTKYPPVAIITSSYKEPLSVIEDTLTCFYNLTYPNKYLYFLDDTRYDLPNQDPVKMAEYRKAVDALCQRIGVNVFRRKWHGAKAGMINDWLEFSNDQYKEGFQFRPYQNRPRPEREKYVVIFDADMNAFPDFCEELVQELESDERMAFVQTPQYYTNFDINRVARASGLQQVIFYEYICEGKSTQDAMFCCGTNVIFRRDALIEVGGFDHTSVTEDFATSLKFHLSGWRSRYLNKVAAFGLGPEDMGGYFKQQFRWALGTVGMFRPIFAEFRKNPRGLPLTKWWEYLLSASYYFVGWTFVALAVCPLIYLFFGIPKFFARPDIFMLIFTPYLLLTFGAFFASLGRRGYTLKEMVTALLLNSVTFPVYMKASLLGIFGVRGSFAVTPKGSSAAMPLSTYWPQLLLGALSIAALVWGSLLLFYGDTPRSPILVNMLWCVYHLGIVSTVLYFNFPEETALGDEETPAA